MLAATFGIDGCIASTRLFVSNDYSKTLKTTDSSFHQFKYVRLYEEDGALVLYGKIAHTHQFCEGKAHVDLAGVDADGTVIYKSSLAIRPQSGRKRGWYGAAFRTRIPTNALGNGTLQLSFHDAGCHGDHTFDCDDNRAAHASTR